jgi:hypothetical protein
MITVHAMDLADVSAIIPPASQYQWMDILMETVVSRLCRARLGHGYLDRVKPNNFDFSESTTNSQLDRRQHKWKKR